MSVRIAESAMVIGIKNSIHVKFTCNNFSVERAKVSECPSVNAVTKYTEDLKFFKFRPIKKDRMNSKWSIAEMFRICPKPS